MLSTGTLCSSGASGCFSVPLASQDKLLKLFSCKHGGVLFTFLVLNTSPVSQLKKTWETSAQFLTFVAHRLKWKKKSLHNTRRPRMWSCRTESCACRKGPDPPFWTHLLGGFGEHSLSNIADFVNSHFAMSRVLEERKSFAQGHPLDLFRIWIKVSLVLSPSVDPQIRKNYRGLSSEWLKSTCLLLTGRYFKASQPSPPSIGPDENHQ